MINLTGGYVHDIGLSADMFWIIVYVNDIQYAVDIQSSFRILFDNKIIFASTDIYLEKDKCQKKISACKSITNICECYITDLCVNLNNDLRIKLNNNTIIETFTDSSDKDDEQWRIFERHNDKKPHYVAYFDRICDE